MTDYATRLWVDDLRKDPDTDLAGIAEPQGWIWAKNSSNAIAFLIGRQAVDEPLEEISLDHDLGYNKIGGVIQEDTGFRVLDWMIANKVWPKELVIHTANPVARERMILAANRYAPQWVEIKWVWR